MKWRKVGWKFCKNWKCLYICTPDASGNGFEYFRVKESEYNLGKGSDGRVARQRSAKPCTAVRIRFRPHKNRVVYNYNAVFFLVCHTFVIQ